MCEFIVLKNIDDGDFISTITLSDEFVFKTKNAGTEVYGYTIAGVADYTTTIQSNHTPEIINLYKDGTNVTLNSNFNIAAIGGFGSSY